MPTIERIIHSDSLENISKLTFLFRGLRNKDSLVNGNWWTEDSFYALSISGPDSDLAMLVLPKTLLYEYLADGRAQDQTYREGNTNESEIKFLDTFLYSQSSSLRNKNNYLLVA